ncbi:hypothetical protein D3C78_1613400 [compost metagenome]
MRRSVSLNREGNSISDSEFTKITELSDRMIRYCPPRGTMSLLCKPVVDAVCFTSYEIVPSASFLILIPFDSTTLPIFNWVRSNESFCPRIKVARLVPGLIRESSTKFGLFVWDT